MNLLLAIPFILVITSLALLLGKVEPSKIQKVSTILIVGLKEITIIGAIGIILLLVLTFFVMRQPVRNLPIVEKQINEQYYFTQQEYSHYNDTSGTIIHLYRNKPWLKDYKVGTIDKPGNTSEISINLETMEDRKVRLLLFSGKTLELDTVLRLDGHFLYLGGAFWKKRLNNPSKHFK